MTTQRPLNDHSTTTQRPLDDHSTHEVQENRIEENHLVQQHMVVDPAHARETDSKKVVVFEGENKGEKEEKETPKNQAVLDPDTYVSTINGLQQIFCRTDAPHSSDSEVYESIIRRKGPQWVLDKGHQHKDVVLAKTVNRPPWPLFRGILQSCLKDPHDGKSLGQVIAEIEKQKFLAKHENP